MTEQPRSPGVDLYTLSNDRHGYSVYSTVLFASRAQQASVDAIRAAVRVRRSMMPAHVTVKGPFHAIPSIDDVKLLVDAVSARTKPIEVLFEGAPRVRRSRNDEVFATQAVLVTPTLLALHEGLRAALDPVSTNAYQGGRAYHPHLTIYHEPEPEFEQAAADRLAGLVLGRGFMAHEVHLVGHVGRPFRGRWETISVHRFAG